MKKIGLIGLIGGAFSAAVIGFAGPAQADGNALEFIGLDNGSSVYDNDSNYPWRDQLFPVVKVPQVDTSVHN
jgi:hypothetical protein